MNNRIEQIKEHVKKHKVVYSCGVTAVTTVGITYLVVRGANLAQCGEGCLSTPNVGSTNIASLKFSNKSTINITTVLDREGRGHPGWPVRNLETKRIFFSQREAADTFSIGEGTLSSHLNGKFPDANGLHFERVNLVPE